MQTVLTTKDLHTQITNLIKEEIKEKIDAIASSPKDSGLFWETSYATIDNIAEYLTQIGFIYCEKETKQFLYDNPHEFNPNDISKIFINKSATATINAIVVTQYLEDIPSLYVSEYHLTTNDFVWLP